jgi:AbrB family looped-hinge helix DNA binding protein
MPRIKLSDDFRIRIPEQIRERVDLKPGDELKVHLHGHHILLVPVRSEDRRSENPTRRNLISMTGIGGTGF